MKKVLIAIGVMAVLLSLVLFAFSGDNFQILKNLVAEDYTQEELRDQLMEFGWRGYIAMAVIAMLQVVCTFLPAEPFQMLSGYTFGFPVGLLCCMAGVIAGSGMIYLLQKIFGDKLRGFFMKKLDLDLGKIARSSKAMFIIVLLYLLPVIPYGMICFFAAGLGMSYRRYFLVTSLGALPSVCIGVALGSMAFTVDWKVTVCVLAVLIVLAAILFFKKDLLFSRLNRYADENKESAGNKVRNANGFVLAVLYGIVRIYFFVCGVRVKTVSRIERVEMPSIVLCNHGSFIDFVYAMSLLRKYKPHFIGARLYFYHKYLGWLLRTVGAFPKSMFAPDMENARNCFTVLRRKNMLAMMPEARLSTAGQFEDIQENTYSFLKTAGVNIYTVKIDGNYLADPKWGKGFRRGAVVEAELDILYTAEEIAALSLEDMKQGIQQRLFYDEFEWLKQRPDIRYHSRRMAEGLENILTFCPICGGRYTIRTKKDKVYCQHCGYLTSLDKRYAFTGDFRFENLAQWYNWQKEQLEKEIAENAGYELASKVELRLPGTGKGLTRHGGWGVCALNREGLTYTGTKEGENVEIHFNLQRIYRLLFGAGQNFEIYNGTEILYFVPEDKRSSVDWYMASMILHDEAAAKAE